MALRVTGGLSLYLVLTLLGDVGFEWVWPERWERHVKLLRDRCYQGYLPSAFGRLSLSRYSRDRDQR